MAEKIGGGYQDRMNAISRNVMLHSQQDSGASR